MKKNKKTVQILLMPTTPKELAYANTYLTFIEDSIKVYINAFYENMEDINLEDSIAVEFLTKSIQAINNNNSIEEMKELLKEYTYKDGKTLARLVYEMQVITHSNPEGFSNYISKKCGIDITDELELMKFSAASGRIKELLSLERLAEGETENLDSFIYFANYYHDFYINGIKDKQNREVQEILTELLGEMPEFLQPSEGISRTRKNQ